MTAERPQQRVTPGETSAEAVLALQIVESMPAYAWSADTAGRFIYVSPSTLAFLGSTPDDLNYSPDEDEFGWQRVVHPDDYDRVAARWRHCLKTGDHYDTEHRMRGADGVYRWFRNSGRPCRDVHGRITQWYGTTIDIDDQKRTEAALRERERELSQLVDLVPSHLWRLAPDGEPVFFNKRMIDFLGLDVAGTEKPGMTKLDAIIADVVHPGDAAAFAGVLNRCLETGERFSMRYRLRRFDGVYRWMSSRAEPIRDQGGTIVQWYGLCHDIDDQVRAEEAVHDREQELSQLVDMVPSLLWRLTPDGEPTFFNKRLIDFLGVDITSYDEPGVGRLAAAIAAAVHPDDAAGVGEALNRSFVTGEPYLRKYRVRRADGVYRWMEGRAEPMRDQGGHIVQWYGLLHDVDEELRAEVALRLSEWRLRQLIDALPAMIWSTSSEGTPTYVNKRFTDVIGATVEDITAPDGAPSLAAIIHPDDLSATLATVSCSFATGVPYVMQYRQLRRDGSYRWTETRAEPLRDISGAILQWYGVSVDIDDMMNAQTALSDRERELSVLVDMIPSHLWRVTPDGETTLVNKHMVDFFGEDWKMKWDTAIDTIVHPDDLKGVLDEFGRCLRTGERFSMQYRLRRVDGVYRWMSGRAEPMLDESGAILQWFGLCHDIDDQVHAEEALRHTSRKLAQATQAASLAELSASIAHEVNQPLAAIVANSHACHRWLSAEPPNVERAKVTAERITRDANSAADVVSRIRALFRRASQARSPEDVNRVIGEVCRLMTDEIAAKDILIETNLEPGLPPITLDRVQVQQVFVNLIRNGIEAMDAVADGTRSLQIRSHRDGLDEIRVEICDAGTGFEDAERVFEPFFTTKPNGMGMGLAICRSIIESHGGRLWTANNETHGATVAFTLPLAAGEAP